MSSNTPSKNENRRYILKRFCIDGLELETFATPELRPRQVLVRIHAVSLNYRDLMVINGRSPYPPIENLVPISDGAGEVIAVGSSVTRFKVGDAVVPTYCQGWIDGEGSTEGMGFDLGGAIDGVLADIVVFEEEGLAAMPPQFSFEQAATFPVAAVTAWSALTRGCIVRPGQTVLTQGTGGVSLFALTFAKLMGAKVIATTSTSEKEAFLSDLGADVVINYKANPEWQDDVLQATDGRGVDLVVEVGGPGTFSRSMQCTRVGGHLAFIGLLESVETKISPIPFIGQRLSIQGINAGSRADLEAAMNAFASNGKEPVIDKVFSFSDIKDALQYFEGRNHVGKVVISMQPS